MSALDDLVFVLWGRFTGTTHAALTQRIISHGGLIEKDLDLATHLLCDAPGSRLQEAEAFQADGGTWVDLAWLEERLKPRRTTRRSSQDTLLPPTKSVKSTKLSLAPSSHVQAGSSSTATAAAAASSTTTPHSNVSSLRPTAPPFTPATLKTTAKKRRASVSLSPLLSFFTKGPASPQPTTAPSRKKRKTDNVLHDTGVPSTQSLGLVDLTADDVDGPLDDCIVPLDELYLGSAQDQVLIDEGGIWDAMLNQTDIASNKNKYYAIQIIKRASNTQGGFAVFSRWGRVGIRGQSQLHTCYSVEEAKDFFRRKFKEKTRIAWADRHVPLHFQAANRYVFISREYQRKSAASAPNSPEKKRGALAAAQSKLNPAVQSLLTLLFDVGRMEEEMREQGVNIQELPLGRLTKQQIRKGFLVLAEISDEIIKAKPNETDLLNLSSRFYSQIPHRAKGTARPAVIRTAACVKKKLSLLQSLEDLRVGTDLLEEKMDEATTLPVHRLDANYEKLKCKIDPLPATDIRYKMIQQYVDFTHNGVLPDWGTSHKIQVDAIFSLQSELDARFMPFSREPNRQLLWHCSRIGNFTGILSKGLRIAPKEAPSSGFRLGKGIYFTNTLQKAQQYCYASSYPSDQCMLLCEVALGESQRRLYDDYTASSLEAGKSSTWGVGVTQHDEADHVTMEDGVLVPMGKSIMAAEFGEMECSAFTWNELVVYDVARVRPRFLLKTTFLKV
ncbi:poly polymerase catalytic domain-domain-containing protein [Protomyces lactucae-debilis]|uniref:Poly [ADP-ribose] polymerase n=1 Tax=Protomyces lactucae-debilis TaxID=2754530 RepID=A0A1Y2EX83_PROLT|nr:poly polymerase catalytic domain-containing protein [Protomyces lactucae-debilis]ORY76107.1 poly polymerase catalytic domain-domain-containing protein [Protomyces lactucae-debilis]